MACFLVPTAEAIVTTIVGKSMKEKEPETITIENEDGEIIEYEKISTKKKIGWLNKLLIGGSVLLAVEHLWHGEVTPWFPFLTAMNSEDSAMTMLEEMATVGVSMAVLVTMAWGGMVAFVSSKEKKLVELAKKKKALE